MTMDETIDTLKTALEIVKEERDSILAKAIGWTWSEACITLDRGGDPRNTEIPGLLERAMKDLVG